MFLLYLCFLKYAIIRNQLSELLECFYPLGWKKHMMMREAWTCLQLNLNNWKELIYYGSRIERESRTNNRSK
jgi:hypothetical protein